MRCLVLSPYVPFPPHSGSLLRTYHLLEGLSRRHDVELVAFDDADSPRAGELRERGFKVESVEGPPGLRGALPRALLTHRSVQRTRFLSAAFAATMHRRLRAERWDVVQCEFFYMGQYRPRGDSAGPVWVVNEHNVEFRLVGRFEDTRGGVRAIPFRAYVRRERRLRRHDELAICARMDRVLAVSEADREVLLSEAPDLSVDVVPNGVDLAHFTPARAGDEPPGGVFVGTMEFRPNVDAVLWFCAEILPAVQRELPDFEFTIVGPEPPPAVRKLADRPGVRVTGRVPDTRPYLRAAAVVTVPLRAGSGTRLKILEALAMGRAVVTTTLGAEGLQVQDGIHLAVVDTPEQFAAATIALARDTEARKALAVRGRRLVEELYGWPAAVEHMEHIYEGLLAAAGPRP